MHILKYFKDLQNLDAQQPNFPLHDHTIHISMITKDIFLIFEDRSYHLVRLLIVLYYDNI